MTLPQTLEAETGRSGFVPAPEPRWLYLDLNCYFASVEQALNEDLIGRPVGVVPLMGKSSTVIAASREAKRHGIKTGTSLKDARRVCPDIVFVEARHDVYVRMHNRIKALIGRFVPLETVYSIDDFVCHLKANEAGIARGTDIAHRIKRAMHEEFGPAITCSIGLAPNRYLAKVATEIEKPDGLVILTADALPGRLLELRPGDLPGIGKGMAIRLDRAGVHDIAALWQCGPKHLRALWHNVEGERLWYRLRGYPVPDSFATVGRMIGHSHVLPFEARDPEKARPIARRLIQKAASRLRRRQCVAAAVDLSVRFMDSRRWGGTAFIEPAHDLTTLTRAVDGLWARMLAEEEVIRSTRLKKVAVLLHRLSEENAPQGELFGPQAASAASDPALSPETRRAKTAALSHALDTLNQRYGQDTVAFGHLPVQTAPYVGAKIAFNRIPEGFDFHT